MHKARTLGVFLFLAMAGGMAQPALATLPADRTVSYLIREYPEDPESAVVFKVELDLKAQSADGDSIGWLVQKARFYQIHGETTVAWWEKVGPSVPTGDGLWWIEHDDAEAPLLSEFVDTPQLTGTADSKTSGVEDLAYDFISSTYTPPPGGPAYTVTSSTSHEFTEVDEEEPVEAGENEPTEVL